MEALKGVIDRLENGEADVSRRAGSSPAASAFWKIEVMVS